MPHTTPQPLALTPTFGYGDRLGLASPGHLAAHQRAGGAIRGFFAQQSIREMARTNRQPTQVMTAAVDAIQAAGFDEVWGSDADHLKTHEDVDRTMAAGFTFFTLDPSDHVDQQADRYSDDEVNVRFAPLAERMPWHADYLGQTVTIPDGPTLSFDDAAVRRAVVKYGPAIDHAAELGQYILDQAQQAGREVELELSVDETEEPTTLAEHYLVADQLRQRGVPLVSLAPRYVGEFEKGVDYKGDLAALEASLKDHAAIAAHLGPYKLSLHSGSDKLSIYPAFARATQGRLHVKTAGTSYLEALRVAARLKPELFREVVDFSRSRYDTDKATYHVSATLDHTPEPQTLDSPQALEREYLELWPEVEPGKGFTKPGRQILHCCFGSVLTDGKLGPALMDLLQQEPDAHRDILADHFVKHLEALHEGMA